MSDSPDFMTGIEVCEKFKVHRATIARWVRRGLFPAPLKLGPQTSRWRTEDIDRIANSLPRSRNNGLIESGWIVEQPDVAPEQLAPVDDNCLSVAERAELAGLKTVSQVVDETGMRSIEEIVAESSEEH